MTPLNDAIVAAVAEFVDDSQSDHRRDPSHSDLEFLINRAGLKDGDPKQSGQVVGKAKRIRGTLSWALEHGPESGGKLVVSLVNHIRGQGGFRSGSPNYVGRDAIETAIKVFDSEGFQLSLDGELRPKLLDNLSGTDLTDALDSYVRRAKRGSDDAALVTGTGKDLLEAVAAHVLRQRYGSYSQTSNFPTLLGQAFAALNLSTPQSGGSSGRPMQRIENAMYELACGINQLRNKQGTGHGRPWLPSITEAEARTVTEFMGITAEYLLSRHAEGAGK